MITELIETFAVCLCIIFIGRDFHHKIKCIILGDENMVTVQFNNKLVKNSYRRFCSGDVNSEKQTMIPLWFTRNKRTQFSVKNQFCSLDFTPIAAFAIVGYKIPATVFRMYKGEGRFFTGVTV